jgi:PAS domain S-box-containing protein
MTSRASDDALRQQLSDPRFRALTERVQDIIAVVDAMAIVLHVSSAIERVLGYRPEELRGVSSLELVHPDDRPSALAALAELSAAPNTTVNLGLRLRCKDGSYRDAEVVAHNLLGDPAVGAIVVNARDVTELRRMLGVLADSERRFRMLAENARDVVTRYRLLPEPALEYISPSVERMTGYTPAELYADPQVALRLIAPEDRERLTRLLSGLARQELGVPQTLCWLRKDGERVWIEQQTVLIYDAAGQLAAAESICRDVTERVLLEEQLKQAQKLEAIGTLAAGVAHDFNNLLMTIFAHVGRLESRLGADADSAESVVAIKDTVRRAAALSDQLLAFARKGRRIAVVVDLEHAVARFEVMLRRLLPAHIVIRLELAGSANRVRLDPSQLDQILLNLALNARDAMPDGGTLTIRTAAAGEGRVRLVVQDTGVGITDRDLPHVFEPFFTTKQRQSASGLGLAVVYGIVQRLQGSVRGLSRPGEGACFVIELPTTDDALDSPPPTVRARAAEGGGETLLLVEDQRAVRNVLAQVLREAGYRVLEAESGAAALRLAGLETVAVLITDMVMPDMGGAALVEHMRANRPSLPAVCMSGYAGDELDPRVAPGVETVFLAKPFLPDELLTALRRLLGSGVRTGQSTS